MFSTCLNLCFQSSSFDDDDDAAAAAAADDDDDDDDDDDAAAAADDDDDDYDDDDDAAAADDDGGDEEEEEEADDDDDDGHWLSACFPHFSWSVLGGEPPTVPRHDRTAFVDEDSHRHNPFPLILNPPSQIINTSGSFYYQGGIYY